MLLLEHIASGSSSTACTHFLRLQPQQPADPEERFREAGVLDDAPDADQRFLPAARDGTHQGLGVGMGASCVSFSLLFQSYIYIYIYIYIYLTPFDVATCWPNM